MNFRDNRLKIIRNTHGLIGKVLGHDLIIKVVFPFEVVSLFDLVSDEAGIVGVVPESFTLLSIFLFEEFSLPLLGWLIDHIFHELVLLDSEIGVKIVIIVLDLVVLTVAASELLEELLSNCFLLIALLGFFIVEEFVEFLLSVLFLLLNFTLKIVITIKIFAKQIFVFFLLLLGEFFLLLHKLESFLESHIFLLFHSLGLTHNLLVVVH